MLGVLGKGWKGGGMNGGEVGEGFKRWDDESM